MGVGVSAPTPPAAPWRAAVGPDERAATVATSRRAATPVDVAGETAPGLTATGGAGVDQGSDPVLRRAA